MSSSGLRRLRKLPTQTLVGDRVFVADTLISRLLGLTWLRQKRLPVTHGLLLTQTRSIHTFGMWFDLDLFWLDREGEIIRIDRAVKPFRLRTCRGAVGVVEKPSTQAT